MLLDSKSIAVGQNYSQWNDVFLTPQGKYGARSSQEIGGDESSSIMYVVAPIKNGDEIIGVVSVAKPNHSVQPFIERTQRRLGILGGGLILLGLLSGAIFPRLIILSSWTTFACSVPQYNYLHLPSAQKNKLRVLIPLLIGYPLLR